MKPRIITLTIILFAFVLNAQEENATLSLTPYGFIRLNTTLDFQDMGNSDHFHPALIPTESSARKTPHLFLSAKQSRFGLKIEKSIQGQRIQGRIEGD